jgi:OOP family OmpA-OmpF porin
MMIRKKIFYLLIIFSVLHANIPETEIGINLGATSTQNEPSSKFENPTFGVTYQNNSYVVMPRVDVEYVKLKNEEATALIKASVNGVYEYENKTNISPYVLAGFGYEKVQGEVENVIESHAFVQGGAGLRIDIKEGYKARIEGKFLQILGGSNEENEAIITAGLTIPLTYRKPIIKRKPRPIVRPVVRVNPIPPVVIPSRPKIIYSNVNECSIKISAPDLDRDGIEDRLDQCPSTPCNFSVDTYGCPIKATLQINFANNSAKMKIHSLDKVNEFARFLLRSKGSMVTIEGHTDSVGSSRSNLALSHRRAKTVVKALIRQGISPARIQAEGKGESMPIASNKTTEGKAENRRIEAVLSYPRGRK